MQIYNLKCAVWGNYLTLTGLGYFAPGRTCWGTRRRRPCWHAGFYKSRPRTRLRPLRPLFRPHAVVGWPRESPGYESAHRRGNGWSTHEKQHPTGTKTHPCALNWPCLWAFPYFRWLCQRDAFQHESPQQTRDRPANKYLLGCRPHGPGSRAVSDLLRGWCPGGRKEAGDRRFTEWTARTLGGGGVLFLIQLLLTFSPISVSSPPASSFRSGTRAQASITCQNRSSSKGEPKRTLSLSVAFWIQACCGTKAREPWEGPD